MDRKKQGGRECRKGRVSREGGECRECWEGRVGIVEEEGGGEGEWRVRRTVNGEA